MQRGYRPEPWNAPRAARKPEASLRAVQARAGYAGGRPRAAPRCCSLATLESVCLPPRTSHFQNHVKHGCESRMSLAIVTNRQRHAGCRASVSVARLAAWTTSPLAAGRPSNKLHPSFRHCKKQNLRANSKLQLPGSLRRFCLLIIPPTPAPIPGHSS